MLSGLLGLRGSWMTDGARAVAFFFVLSRIYRKERRAKGEVFLLMVMLYGAWRWVIEFARGDKRPEWGGLFYSQWISMAAFAAAGVWIFLLRRRAKTPGADASALPSAGGKPAPPPPAATQTL